MREELLQGPSEDGQVMPMNKWLSRATLDAIGEGAYLHILQVIFAHRLYIQLHSITISAPSTMPRTSFAWHTRISS